MIGLAFVLYFVLMIVALLHVTCCMLYLFGFRILGRRLGYNFHGLLAAGSIGAIICLNAFFAIHTDYDNQLIGFIEFFFGAGRAEGALKLGCVGIYWFSVAIVSALVMFGSSRAATIPSRRKPLPIGGLWTISAYLAVLVALVVLFILGLKL